jgi:hypothetical protein
MRQTILDLGKRKARERGGILVIAIIVILAMLILAIPFLFKLSASNRSTERAARALSALNLAEAGAEKVIWDINQGITSTYDPTADIERINWSLDGTNGTINSIRTADAQIRGDVAFTLTPDPDPVGFAPVTRLLNSTGMVPFISDRTVDRTVGITLEKYFGSIWDYGFLVRNRFYMHNGIEVDSVDSGDPEPLDEQEPGSSGDFLLTENYSAGAFEVVAGGTGNTIFTGNVIAVQSEETPSSPDITDVIDIKALPDEKKIAVDTSFFLPPVDVFTLHPKSTWPDPSADISKWFSSSFTDGTATPAIGDINAGYNKSSYTVSGSQTFTSDNNGVYTDFDISDNSALNISGDVILYVTGLADGVPAHFNMGTDSKINILDGGSLTLVLGKTSFYADSKFTINAPDGNIGTPTNCTILGTEAFAPSAPIDKPVSVKTAKSYSADPDSIPVGSFAFEQGTGSDWGIISAAIYTPRAQVFDLHGQNNIEVYGAWIAGSMFFKVQMAFHYDEALGDRTDNPGGPPKWKILNWQEKVGN